MGDPDEGRYFAMKSILNRLYMFHLLVLYLTLKIHEYS